MIPIERVFSKRKHKRGRRRKRISAVCCFQNSLRNDLRKIIPKNVISVEDAVFGIDYCYGKLKIDHKFSFGALGENTIKIRTTKRRLLNKSNLTKIINKNKEIEFFETKKLAEFVRKNWPIVQKNTLEKKEYYWAHKIKLEEFYSFEGITPIKIDFCEEKLYKILEEFSAQKIDYSKQICFLNCLF